MRIGVRALVAASVAVTGLPSAAQQVPGGGVAAPVVAPDAASGKGAADAGNARIELSGKVQLDVIQDFRRVDPAWNSTLRPSTIPVRCPGDPGCGKDGESVFSVRQSSLAIRGFVPTGAGELRTEFSMDLFGVGGGNTQMRLLNAWAEIGPFGAGQYDSLFMNGETFPRTIDYWGPSGMVFVRNPQLRWNVPSRDGLSVAVSIEAPNSAIDTGKVADVDPALGVRGRSPWPDVVGRVGVQRDRVRLQAAGIVRTVAYETANTPGHAPSGTRTGWGLNVSGVANTVGRDRLVGQLVYGKGIASYMNDGGVDIAPNAALKAELVPSLGGFLYYDRHWSDRWSSSIGYSVHRQDTLGGQRPDAFRQGRYASVNLLWYPARNVLVGGELLWGRKVQLDGAQGDDVRLQVSSQFRF